MSRTYRRDERLARPAWAKWSDLSKHAQRREEVFRCLRCKQMVYPPPSGGHHRNHCPLCLYSRHVDRHRPGDRASDCGGAMAPVAVFTRPNGEQAVVHRCLACAVERYTRLAADDNVLAVMRLPLVARPAAAGEAGRRAAWV